MALPHRAATKTCNPWPTPVNPIPANRVDQFASTWNSSLTRNSEDLQAHGLPQVMDLLFHKLANLDQRRQTSLDLLGLLTIEYPETYDVLDQLRSAQAATLQLIENVQHYLDPPKELELQPCSWVELVHSAWQTGRYGLESPGARLVMRVHEPGGDRARLDVMLIAQGLAQIFRNAAEAARGSARRLEIVVDLDRLRDPRGQGNWLTRLRFRDRGPGLSPKFAGQTLDRLTEPFTTSKPTAVGLGLTLVDQVIRRHGGWLELTLPPAGDDRPGREPEKADGGLEVRWLLPGEELCP